MAQLSREAEENQSRKQRLQISVCIDTIWFKDSDPQWAGSCVRQRSSN